MKTQYKVLIGLTILLALFWNPFSRAVILWLLPLGSGVDDFVFIALAILVFVGWFTPLWPRAWGWIYSSWKGRHDEQ